MASELQEIGSEFEEDESLKLNQFIETSKLLYEADGINCFSSLEIAKFLISKEYHQGKALESLAECLAWRKSYGVESILNEDFVDHEKSCKLQFFGEAMNKSKCLVLTAKRYEQLSTQKDIDDNARFIIYTLEKARRDGSLADKITLVVDITGKKMGKQEIRLAATIVPLLQKYYPERLSRLYLFPTNTLFNMSYQMSSYILDKKTIPKIHLVESPAALAEWMNRDQYFKQFGGLATDPSEMLSNAPAAAASSNQSKNKADDKGSENQVLKSASVALIEEIFVAPPEFRGI